VTDFLDSLNGAFGRGTDVSVQGLLLSLALAFLLGQLLAWTYTWTHRGLSYSRAFTHSLVIMAVVIALLMMVIGTSIVTAFGLLGALALVRFRNVLKDTRDTVFVLMSIVIGISVGTQRYADAIIEQLANA
jgi:ABC-type spermidine/putrescine transport system permease subunit II